MTDDALGDTALWGESVATALTCWAAPDDPVPLAMILWSPRTQRLDATNRGDRSPDAPTSTDPEAP